MASSEEKEKENQLRRKGAAFWDNQDSASWQKLLDVPAVYLFETTSSTNDVARELAEAGAPTLTTIIADHQTAGRGRGGKDWLSEPGSSLLCTIIFRLSGTADAPGAAPIRVGLAVADAVEQVAGVEAAVKWPNDVVIENHGKVAGILCEGALREHGGYIVAGIGVNVRHAAAGYASLEQIADAEVSRGELLIALVERLRPSAQRMTAPLTATELAAARARDILFDQEVESDDGVRGRACGIGSDGSLNVQTSGGLRVIHSATIRLADTRAYPGARS